VVDVSNGSVAGHIVSKANTSALLLPISCIIDDIKSEDPESTVRLPPPFKMLANLSKSYATKTDDISQNLSKVYAREAVSNRVLNIDSSDLTTKLIKKFFNSHAEPQSSNSLGNLDDLQERVDYMVNTIRHSGMNVFPLLDIDGNDADTAFNVFCTTFDKERPPPRLITSTDIHLLPPAVVDSGIREKAYMPSRYAQARTMTSEAESLQTRLDTAPVIPIRLHRRISDTHSEIIDNDLVPDSFQLSQARVSHEEHERRISDHSSNFRGLRIWKSLLSVSTRYFK
jgi:hypothetical protein